MLPCSIGIPSHVILSIQKTQCHELTLASHRMNNTHCQMSLITEAMHHSDDTVVRMIYIVNGKQQIGSVRTP